MLGANNSINIKRLSIANGLETYGTVYLLKNIGAYIVKAKPEVAMMFNSVNAYDVFTCYIEGNYDIQISDLVVDQQGNQYVVKDFAAFTNNTDVPDQMTLTLFKTFLPT